MTYVALLMPLLLQGATLSPVATLPDRAVQLGSRATTPELKRDDERVICRRQPKNGSLAGFRRVCHTRAQWQRTAGEAKANWRDIQGHKGSAWCQPGYDGTVGSAPKSCE